MRVRKKRRPRAPITPDLLLQLARIAEDAHTAFFARRPRNVYRERFIAAALCQGAALHYLGLGTGVNDFDLHLFYRQHPIQPQVARRKRTERLTWRGFGSRRVDILRTVLPARGLPTNRDDLISVIRTYLRRRPTETAARLAEKPVIGLFPATVFGKVIWPDISSVDLASRKVRGSQAERG
jgi:hypothetical protein